MSDRFVVGLGTGSDGRTAVRGALDRATADTDSAPGDASFAVVFASPEYDPEAVAGAVRGATGATLLGCTSVGEFTHREWASGSVGVALSMGGTHRVHTGLGYGVTDDEEAAVREATAAFPAQPSSPASHPYRSVLDLHDGLAGKGEEVTLASNVELGPDVRIAGGSAGDDLRLEATHVMADETVTTDGVGLGLVESRQQPAISVAHGHSPVSPPLRVTESDGAVVHELDGRPAFEVWREQIRDRAAADGIDVDAFEAGGEDLSTALTNYAFGLVTGNGLKIRWPGLTDEPGGSLRFACSMPEGVVLRVTAGSREAQVASARRAAREARASLDGEPAGALVFDCICRSTALGEGFSAAVDAMAEDLDVPLLGFETYGEVAMDRDQLSGYHNTTTVIYLLPR
jgi:methyl-accepting chemotaxis protein